MDLKNKIDCENLDTIQELLETNTFKRNKHLNNIIKIFNSMSSSITLSIDGNWGTGKTIFAKQLEYVSLKRSNYAEIDEGELAKFQRDFNMYYFNSWEYDMYENPLEIFLFDLIKHQKSTMSPQDNNIEKLEKIIEKYLVPITNTAFKAASGGYLDFMEIFEKETKKEKLLKSTTHIDELKESISKILSILTESKSIIIIIDELDRCKPTFAVELLEIIKHYFSFDKISFIICSNKYELSHTIKQYYGHEFDGFAYLDRFIDFEYNLPEVSLEDYIDQIYKTPYHEGYFSDLTKDQHFSYKNLIIINAKLFKLTLRQINKYCLLAEILISQFIIDRSSQNCIQLLIFPMYALGLKLTNPTEYEIFLEGNGKEKLESYVHNNFEFLAIVLQFNDNLSKSISSKQALYNHFFREYNLVKENKRTFLEILSNVK